MHLHDLWTNMCGLGGVACAFGWSVMHVQQMKCEKEGKASVCITWKSLRMTSAFLNCTEREDMVVYQDDPRALFASLGVAALSHTHRSRRELHGVEAAFTLSSPPFSHQALSSSSLLSQLLPFWHRDNETANAATALRMINWCKCIQLFVQDVLIAFLNGTDVAHKPHL